MTQPLCSPRKSAPALQTLNSISSAAAAVLDLELAVCWVLECLLKDDNYPSGLLQKLNRDKPQLRLSETVLQQALDFLEQQGSISTYTQRCPSRGRPRRMLHLQPDARRDAEQLMEPWQSLLDSHSLVLPDRGARST